jgi:hypothetical protein
MPDGASWSHGMPQFNVGGDPPLTWQIFAHGWGFAPIDPASRPGPMAAGPWDTIPHGGH